MELPNGFMAVIAFLCLGYLLFLVELVVPGGVLGILGILSVIYGCYVAFDLGPLWGMLSIFGSLVFFAAAMRFMLHSKAGRSFTLTDDQGERDWKSTDTSLAALVGADGVALTPLRPSGVASFGERRVDVVSDSLFLDAGTALRVVSVEGRRVLVEATDSPESAKILESPESLESQSPSGSADLDT